MTTMSTLESESQLLSIPAKLAGVTLLGALVPFVCMIVALYSPGAAMVCVTLG